MARSISSWRSAIIEHLPRDRRTLVDEYYRVLAPGGHIAILDTPNRCFPMETHSIRLARRAVAPAPSGPTDMPASFSKALRTVGYKDFVADGTGWRNATLAECLPSSGWSEIEDVTEAAGYGSRFFPKVAGRRMIRLGPIFAGLVRSSRVARVTPSRWLPYFNLLFRKRPAPTRRG